MRIVDLSLSLYSDAPVFPGDPEMNIEKVLTLEKDGWEMRRLQINSHDGTHVNVPSHAVIGGKNLDAYTLNAFQGKAHIYTPGMTISSGEGVLFTMQITRTEADWILHARPAFVGLSSNFEFDVELEKELLRAGIISYERLANLDQLPETCMFYGAPLRIREGDGSPVRAYAICE
jgi:kynurenine formamidase